MTRSPASSTLRAGSGSGQATVKRKSETVCLRVLRRHFAEGSKLFFFASDFSRALACSCKRTSNKAYGDHEYPCHGARSEGTKPRLWLLAAVVGFPPRRCGCSNIASSHQRTVKTAVLQHEVAARSPSTKNVLPAACLTVLRRALHFGHIKGQYLKDSLAWLFENSMLIAPIKSSSKREAAAIRAARGAHDSVRAAYSLLPL